MSNRILVAISDHSADNRLFDAAIDLASDLAKTSHDLPALLFLHIIPDGKPDSLFARESVQQRAEAAQAVGFPATAEVAFGLAGRIICQYASAPEWRASHIVIGHRDRSPWKEFALGSVSTYVKEHAPAGCEVVVVGPSSTTALLTHPIPGIKTA